jgi:tetratricopeptide (TPR) repeat protein/CHAT domain-containing protein
MWRARHIQRFWLILALLMAPAISPVLAQPSGDDVAQWEQLNGQAAAAYQAGKYGEGLEWAQQAFEFAERTFGPRHPNTLVSLNNLAALYDSQGRYGEAEPLYEQALQLSRDVLGETHPETLRSLSNLALVYARQDRYGEAEPLLHQALRLNRDVLGETDPNTLHTLHILAALYERQGRSGEVEPLLEQALKVSRDVLGEAHPETLRSLNYLARFYENHGRYRDAEPHYEQALKLRRDMLGESHPDTLQSLNDLAGVYLRQGRYGEAQPLLEQVLQLRRDVLGETHPDTLQSLNNLAFLYQSQGRYGDAGPRYEQALQLSRDVLGETHPSTLTILNNIALLYQSQGRYGEAERLYQQALHLRREVLGETHPDTLQSLNNMAGVYESQGRYGEAEPLYERALKLCREVLGETHPDTLIGLNNLAALYELQGRYDEAEQFHKQALHLRREVLGGAHPDTLISFSNLALLYARQERYGEAEPLLAKTLQLSRDVLGETHPNTLKSLNNLAFVYASQGRNADAEPLYERALKLRREVLGETHPDTLIGLNNLAFLYHSQGRYGDAERLFEQALQQGREALGPTHPLTLDIQLSSIATLMHLDQLDGALRRLRQLESQLLHRLGAELYATESAAVRRGLVASQSSYQDVALSLAVRHPELSEAQELAASAVLRFKGVQGEEEAWLARLTRRSENLRVRELANEIHQLRDQLAHIYHSRHNKVDVPGLIQDLEERELALGHLNPDYKQNYLQVRDANVEDLRGVLSGSTALVEFRQYSPLDFRLYELGAPHWAAIVVRGLGQVKVVDMGQVAESFDLIGAVVVNDMGSYAAAQALYAQLVDPLELNDVETIVLAPDGALNLVPFHRLRLPDGRFWTEQVRLRVVQTGRDLLRPASDQPAKGLLALGGIDFDAAASMKVTALEPAAGPDDTPPGQAEHLQSVTENTFKKEFKQLPRSGEEVEQVAALYRLGRPDEPVTLLTGMEAAESRLKAVDQPPRVLHLATHGFYRAPLEPADQPMVLAGVTLAGANRALRGENENGILYAIEAQNLNLEGTELVVLSACETAQGQIDYGEGVYGLVRALRTAGARNVLVTLRPVGDRAARDFMARFYSYWLAQTESDPALALQETQRDFIRHDPGHDWTPFVLIGGAAS